MRALIFILSIVVVALAVAIVVEVDDRPEFVNRVGRTFYVEALLADATVGESALYREKTSLKLTEFRVEEAPQLPPIQVPYKRIRRKLMDPRGTPYAGAPSGVTYAHRLTDHGWFPLTAPQAPKALDRVWVIRSIHPDTLTWKEEERPCWRVDLIDPALPEGADTVVAWLDDAVPVYGLLKWKRSGETWELVSDSRTTR
jgi:hypothetical protein